MDSRIAEKQFVAENAMELVGHPDDIFRYSTEEQQKILQEKPWTTEYEERRARCLCPLRGGGEALGVCVACVFFVFLSFDPIFVQLCFTSQ